MKIKLLLDHVSRELNFASKLKAVMKETGYGEVTIQHQDYINSGNSYDFIDKTFDGKYDVLITPSYNVLRTPHLLLRAISVGAKLVIYHSEQLYNPVFNNEKLNLGALKAYKKHVVAHLVWGEFYAEKLMTVAGVTKDRIFIVGNYKFDFLHEFHTPHKSNKPKVLVASDFKLGDLSDSDFEKFKVQYNVLKFIPFNRVMALARTECIKWVSEVSDLFPSIHFVLRPHPGENTTEYEQALKTNVSISSPTKAYADDVNDSSLVIGFTTTSVLEVIKAGKVLLSLNLVDFDKSILAQHSSVLTWIDKKQLIEQLAIVDGGGVPQVSNELIEKLNCLIIDSEDVVANVICALKHIVENNNDKTKLVFSDISRLSKSCLVGLIKVVALKTSNKLSFLSIASYVLDRSSKSFSNRQEQGEELDCESHLKYKRGQLGIDESIYVLSKTKINNSNFGYFFTQKSDDQC